MDNFLLKSNLFIYKCDIQFRVVENGILPTFKGSLFRGVFGRVFKKVSCSMYHGDCNKCTISKSCAYFNIFNLENEEQKNNGTLYSPRPYCLRELPKINRVKQNDIISIGFTLIGESNREYLPYLIMSYNLMQDSLYGKDQIKLEFKSIVDSVNSYEYSVNEDIPINFGLISNELIQNDFDTYEIHLITPLRIKFMGKQIFQLDKPSFLYNIKNRYKTLHEHYGIFNKEDLEQIEDFEITTIEEYSTNNKRYSSRQNKKLYLPGIIGKYKIKSNNKKLFNILKRLENLQIGKSTTFGFGQFKIIE